MADGVWFVARVGRGEEMIGGDGAGGAAIYETMPALGLARAGARADVWVLSQPSVLSERTDVPMAGRGY